MSTADLDERLDCVSRKSSGEKRDAAPGRHAHVGVPRPADVSEQQPKPQDLIAGIWRDILGVDTVGIDDDFFESGGDSFQAICLVNRLKEELDIEVPVHELFRCPTIAKILARWPPRSPRGEPSATMGKPGKVMAAATPLGSDQFLVGAGASIDEKKRRMRQFYDTVTDQLASTGVGQHSYFLNLGYEPDGQSQDDARIRIADHLVNSSSIRLVHEVLGGYSPDAGCEVLDAGCGRGGTISQLQQHFSVERITGIDLSPRAIAFCKEHHGASNTSFLAADAEALPFPDQSFDVVLNIESSHSYPNIEAFYREMRRVLRPGGRFLYADLFPVEQWETLRTRLRAAGLTLLHERDITTNVLRACDRVAASRIHAFAADNDATVMADFLAVPGSRLYNDMSSGRSSYRILQLARITTPSQRRPPAHGVLVQLQPGNPARRPMFLVHPVSGTVFPYQSFAHHLGHDRPVYGLRASGLDPGEEFDGEVERMASRYETAIRTRQPHGPYLVGGWSFGGLVAYEIARRLREGGDDVELLLLLDTPAPGDLPADLDRFVPQRPRDVPDASACARVLRQNLDAMRRYRAKSYTGHVLLARATQSSAALPLVSEKAWKALIDGTLDSIDVQANHFTIMAPPHIGMLAEQVKHALSLPF
jgi:thioesterase domain-containing protein/acyl carrier protein